MIRTRDAEIASGTASDQASGFKGPTQRPSTSPNYLPRPADFSKTYTVLPRVVQESATSDVQINANVPPLSNEDCFSLYKPSGSKSNRQMVKNAFERFIFLGPSPLKQGVLATLAGYSAKTNHFLILLRNPDTAPYRGLYAFAVEEGVLEKIHGAGPAVIYGDGGIVKYLKFNSARKRFEVISTKTLSIIIDAFTISNSYWTGTKTEVSGFSGLRR